MILIIDVNKHDLHKKEKITFTKKKEKKGLLKRGWKSCRAKRYVGTCMEQG